jgi:hypothetical protein
MSKKWQKRRADDEPSTIPIRDDSRTAFKDQAKAMYDSMAGVAAQIAPDTGGGGGPADAVAALTITPQTNLSRMIMDGSAARLATEQELIMEFVGFMRLTDFDPDEMAGLSAHEQLVANYLSSCLALMLARINATQQTTGLVLRRDLLFTATKVTQMLDDIFPDGTVGNPIQFKPDQGRLATDYFDKRLSVDWIPMRRAARTGQTPRVSIMGRLGLYEPEVEEATPEAFSDPTARDVILRICTAYDKMTSCDFTAYFEQRYQYFEF